MKPFSPLILALCLCVGLCMGCASSGRNDRGAETRVQALQQAILGLDASITVENAARLSQAAVKQSIQLAREYRAVQPARLHNILVNSGFRPRGLCYEWANDLFPVLWELDCQSIDLHLAVARMDTPREHNGIVATARGQAFHDGIILDPWRHSGRLWFGPVSTDKYPWQPLPRERVAPELEKYFPSLESRR